MPNSTMTNGAVAHSSPAGRSQGDGTWQATVVEHMRPGLEIVLATGDKVNSRRHLCLDIAWVLPVHLLAQPRGNLGFPDDPSAHTA
jgi:hypothetical protein